MPALVTTLTLSKKDFTSNAEAARLDMLKYKEMVGQTDAALKAAQQSARANGQATAEQTTQINTLQAALKKYEQNLRTATAEHKAFRAESAAPMAMPTASRPQASVRMVRSTVAEEGEGGAGLRSAFRGANGQELMHSGRAIASELAAGASPFQAFLVEAPRLFQAFAGSLGGVLTPLLALAGGGAFIKWLSDAQKQAQALREETGLVAQNVNNITGASVKNLTKSLAAANAQVDKVTAARGTFSNKMVNLLTGNGVKDTDVGAAMGQRNKVESRLNATADRDVDFRQRAADGDPGVEADKARADFAAKRNEIFRQVAAREITDGNAAIARAQKELDISLEEIARKQAFHKNEVDMETQLVSIRRYGKNLDSENARAHMEKANADLTAGPQQGPEHDKLQVAAWNAEDDHTAAVFREKSAKTALALEERILAIKRNGYDVELQTAEARLAAAKKVLESGPKQGDEHDKLAASVAATQLEVDTARRTTDEKKSQLQLETQIANLRGSSDQVHQQTLALEAAHLKSLIHSPETTPDERRGYKKDLRQNRQQQDELGKQDDLRGIDTAETLDRAKASRSFADQLELLSKEMQHNTERRQWNVEKNGTDPSMAAHLSEKAKDLAQAMDDLTFAENKRIQSLAHQDTEIRNRGYQPTGEMKDRQIDEKYQNQADEERHGNNNPAVLAGLARNRADEHFENAVDEEQMTPGQRRARQRQNDRRGQAAARVKSRQEHHTEIDAANHPERSFDSFFRGPDRHTIGGHAQPNRQPGSAQPSRQVSAADAGKTADKGGMASLERILNSHTPLLQKIQEQCVFHEQ